MRMSDWSSDVCSSDLQPLHGGDLSSQEGPAVGCLGPCWLVLRRHAAHCIGDTAVDQAEPIARMAAIAALGEAELQEGAIEQVAGVVPGEGAARLVGALQPQIGRASCRERVCQSV